MPPDVAEGAVAEVLGEGVDQGQGLGEALVLGQLAEGRQHGS